MVALTGVGLCSAVRGALLVRRVGVSGVRLRVLLTGGGRVLTLSVAQAGLVRVGAFSLLVGATMISTRMVRA